MIGIGPRPVDRGGSKQLTACRTDEGSRYERPPVAAARRGVPEDPSPPPIPRLGHFARRGGDVNGGAADATWTIFGRGNGNPEPNKETLAWASIVLYLGAVGAVGLPVGRMYAWQCTLYTLGSLLAVALASSYARRQFNMRELASRIIMACNLLILELMAGTIQTEDWTAKDILPDGAVSGEVRMPSKPAPLTTPPIVSLQARLTALAHSVTVSIFPPRVPTVPSLPRLVTRKMQPAGSDNRVREFETLGYLIMAGPTLILVALKWSATVR
jgi:hypothetical protein